MVLAEPVKLQNRYKHPTFVLTGTLVDVSIWRLSFLAINWTFIDIFDLTMID